MMNYLTIIKRAIPNPWRDKLGLWYFNLRESHAASRKPPYRSNPDKIILDITYHCNLGCVMCNRSCQFAPTRDQMGVDQVERFIRESIALKKKWVHIWLEGGEPSLHPELLAMLDLLNHYRRSYSPHTRIQVNSNGYGHEVQYMLRQLPSWVHVFNSAKTSIHQDGFCPFNRAPIDLIDHPVDYTTGCFSPSWYGFGLNMYGYYHCICSAGIDRVMGLDIGRKNLPEPDDLMLDQKDALCRYCGHFLKNNAAWLDFHPSPDDPVMTQTWKELYRRYRESIPRLTRY